MARKTLPSPTDDLNHSMILMSHIKAIADLVEHATLDELYDSTIPNAMDALVTTVEKVEDLIGTAITQVNVAKRLEVVRG